MQRDRHDLPPHGSCRRLRRLEPPHRSDPLSGPVPTARGVLKLLGKEVPQDYSVEDIGDKGLPEGSPTTEDRKSYSL